MLKLLNFLTEISRFLTSKLFADTDFVFIYESIKSLDERECFDGGAKCVLIFFSVND